MRHAFLVLLLGACSTDVFDARRLPQSVAADAQATVDASNAFTCDLYQQLRPSPSNLFASPFSVAIALSMLDLGAAGSTDAQLRSALHQTLAPAATAHAYHAVLGSLDTGATFDGYSLDIANRVFGQEGYPFLPTYTSSTADDYGAPLEPVNFASDPNAAINAVNKWVSQETSGEIPTLFQPGDLDSSTRLVVANAIRFQGAWDAEFEPAHPGTFFLADGTSTPAEMMTKQEDQTTKVAHVDNMTIATMPFRGKDVTMVILLPDSADGLPSLEDRLTAQALTAWLAAPSSVSSRGIDVTIPKFSIDSSFDLATALTALGIVDAWVPDLADFRGIDGNTDLALQRVRHAAHISVDEHGATASAATGGGVQIHTAPPSFVASHPFVFLIHDEVTGAILFIGRFVSPAA